MIFFRLKFQKLINGYRQFDPTRGTHYIIDVLLVDQMKTEYVKRAELMRPLGKNFTDQISFQLNRHLMNICFLGLVEIIPMPFVTETTRIFLILPIHTDEQDATLRFLRHANKTLFEKETRDKFELLLIHVVTNKQESSQSQKWFEIIRHEVDLIRQQRTQLLVTYHTILLSSPSSSRSITTIQILDFFESKLRSNSLIFITNPHVDIEADFLNRCRLNVIENVQVFFPIAFYQYHPHLIARTHHVTDNSTIELHKAHGWFNSYSFDHLGLYLSDYLALKKSSISRHMMNSTMNIYDLFIQITDIHILRAPDQSLRVHYQSFQCDSIKQINLNEFNRCSLQKEKGLASRSQLAMFLIDNEQTKKSSVKRK